MANSVGAAELFVFWGLYSVITKVMKSGSTGESGVYDIVVCAGAIVIFSAALMVYSMMKYIRLRIRSYNMLVIMGMRKRMMYAMMGFEYAAGWLLSMILGILAGMGLLFLILRLWHMAFPEYVGKAEMGIEVYQRTCGVGFAIMAAVLFVLIVWSENKGLSSLTAGEEAAETRPKRAYWLIMVFVGFGLFVLGFFQYFGSEVIGWPYVYAHLYWIMGAFLTVAFAGGFALEKLRKRESFYLKNILKLNSLYSRFQSSLLILLMLLAVHFLALSYCVTGVVQMLPMGDYERYYPYDALWMAQEKETDQAFGEALAEKYKGTAECIPMIRVTNYFNSEHIGISAASYREITGMDSGLKGREIICAVSELKCRTEKAVRSDMYRELNQWLVPGKLTDEWNRYTNDPDGKIPQHDTKYHYQIQKVHTQNWFGEYGIASDCEDVIVFSDEYFDEQRSLMLSNPEEATVLALFSFPKEQKERACRELKSYVDDCGVKDSEWTQQKQSSLYLTSETVKELQKADIFKITNKVFIMVILFMSGLFAVMIKTISEIPGYEKRYGFLESMGINERMKRRTISAEIQSMPSIAVLTAALLSAPYLQMHIMREAAKGIILWKGIWLYWAVLVAVYLMAEYLVQKAFVRYVRRRLGRKSLLCKSFRVKSGFH